MSKLLLQLKAEEHLKRMSAPQRASIRTRVGNRPAIYPYIVQGEWMYFLQNDELVCVSLQQKNGVYHFCFNGRIIEIDCTTGKCFIVDFNRNCIEYFCTDDFFQTAVQNTRYSLLYRLLIRERIDKYKGRSVHSVSIFFTTREVVGQIERAGQSSLKSPLGCLSIHEMVQGIERFIADRVSACVMRSSNLFRTTLRANPMPSQTPLVDQFYGMGLFLTGEFQKPLPSFAMISLIMRRFVGNDSMTGVFRKRIAHGFLTIMISSLSSRMCKMFIENPIGFRKTDEMDNLIQSCPMKISLKSNGFPMSIPRCVSNMIEMNKCRSTKCKKTRDDGFAKQRSLEQIRLEQIRLEQEELRKKQSIQAFQGGIASIEDDVSQAQKRRCVLDEFADGGIEISLEFDETRNRKRKFEDFDEFNV
jgi:hypothetical protein